jgi:MFS family permease
MFQWLLTLGIVVAAIIGIYFSYRLVTVVQTGSPADIFAFKDQAWRRIFWVSLPPGILFVLGSLFVAESPRWLFRRGKREAAHAALLRSRSAEQADIELKEMEEASAAAKSQVSAGKKVHDSLLRRKYAIPFLLACLILACNQATGINSVIAYNTDILLQGGLSDLHAHWGYVIFTVVNFLFTMVGVMLVDRKGRKFLFKVGTAGIFFAMLSAGVLFLNTENLSVDVRGKIQSQVKQDQALALRFDKPEASRLLTSIGDAGRAINADRASLTIIYSYGDFSAAAAVMHSDDPAAVPVAITRDSCVPNNGIEAFFRNPFGNLTAARTAPLKIERALVGSVPDRRHGDLVAIALFVFVAFYSMGPGVCVWLALSELMPTRIRSNGMSIALVINQMVSTILAAVFLPVVSKYGYSTIFFAFAVFAVIYLVATAFFLPETKGKTLEEIEEYFEKGSKKPQAA